MSTINEPCLVLNRNWQPVTFVPIYVAVCNSMRDMASVLDPKSYYLMSWDEWTQHNPGPDALWIKTAGAPIAAPEVIVLKKYGERPPRQLNFNKLNLAKRDDYSCQYCGVNLGLKHITVDHVMPRSRGGGNSWENCVSACAECNGMKADQTPQEAGMKLRRDPVKPDWSVKLAVPPNRLIRKSWEPFLSKEKASAN